MGDLDRVMCCIWMSEIPSTTLSSISLVCEGQSAVSRHLRCSWCSGIWWCCLRRVWCSMLFRLRCHWWRWETWWGRGQAPVGPQMSRAHFWGHAVKYYMCCWLQFVRMRCLSRCLPIWLTTMCSISLEHGPLARYVKLRFAHAPGMPGTFPPAADFKGNH